MNTTITNRSRIYIARVIFLITIPLSCLLFIQHKSDYGILLISFLIFGLLVPLSTLKIQRGTLTLTKYYLYGFISKKHVFVKEDIVDFDALDIELHDSLHEIPSDSIFAIFSSASTAKIPLYRLKWTDQRGAIRTSKINEKQYFEIVKCMRFPHLCS